jgi:hypothetical protein
MSIRDSLASVRKKAAPPPAPPASSPLPKPGAPPVVVWEEVTAACGHVERFGLFEDKKDRFRDARRQKITDRPCKACRAARQQALEAEQARRPVERFQRHRLKGRLPDGAVFHVRYAAATETWSGTLTVGEQVLTGTASGVMRLLSQLDDVWRAVQGGELAFGAGPAAASETPPGAGA